ncbi:MAG: hypothetical protein Q9218_001829 [Villophora microphyllina]
MTAPPLVKRGSATVVEDGFTFTSPSVYIIYSSILASASCIAMTQTYHTVGGVHVVTRAYDADALSSVRCVNSIGIGRNQHSVVWEAMNYNDLYYPIPLSESYSRVDRCFSNRKDNDVWGDWMRKPFISLPKDVSELDPAWSTCSGVAIGAMDPPRALVPAAGFEDSPPPGPGPITQSSPNLPAATPGKTIPDPIAGPTALPEKGGDPQTTSQPQPPTEPKKDPPDPPKDPLRDPHAQQPDPSPTVKEPNMSPEAAAPQPQQPSPNPPDVNPPANSHGDPNHDIDSSPAIPAIGNKDPTAKDPTAQQPEAEQPDMKQTFGNQGGSSSDGQGQLNSISNALFPTPASQPDQGQSSFGGQKSEVPDGPQQVPKPGVESSNDGNPNASWQKATQDSHSEQTDPNKQEKGNAGNQSPPHGQQPATPDSQGPQNVGSQSNGGEYSGAADDDGSSGGGTTKGDTDNTDFGSSGPKNSGSNTNQKEAASPQNDNAPGTGSGDSPNPQHHADVEDKSLPGPTTFAFVSNPPPSLGQDQNIARAPGGAAIVGSVTIQPGQAQIVHGTPVFLAPSAIVVGSSTFALTPPQKSPDEISAGTPPMISQVPGGGLVVGTKTILPGQKDSVNGHEVSVGEANVVVDGKAFALPAVTPPPSTPGKIDIGGMEIAAADGNVNAVVLGGSTYNPGAVVTLSGHTMSVGTGSVVVDGVARTFPSATASSPLLIGGQTVRKDLNGNVIVGTNTILPGSQTTLAGQIISLDKSNHIIINQQTYTLPSSAGVVQTSSAQTPASPLLIASNTISKDSLGRLIIGTSTLLPGSAVTIAGHTISAASDDSDIIIDHSTYALPSGAGVVQSPAPTSPPIVLPNGVTLTPGATAVTVSGKVVSVFANEEGVVVDGSTFTLSATSTRGVVGAEETGLGGFIMSAFDQGPGGVNATAGTSGVAASTPTPTGSGNTPPFDSGALGKAEGPLQALVVVIGVATALIILGSM